TLAPTDQQRHPELAFELTDLLRDVRLHGVERVGRGRERALLVDRQQRLEVPELHRAVLPLVLSCRGARLPSRRGSAAAAETNLEQRWNLSRVTVGQIRCQQATWSGRTNRGAGYPPTPSPILRTSHSHALIELITGVHGVRRRIRYEP